MVDRKGPKYARSFAWNVSCKVEVVYRNSARKWNKVSLEKLLKGMCFRYLKDCTLLCCRAGSTDSKSPMFWADITKGAKSSGSSSLFTIKFFAKLRLGCKGIFSGTLSKRELALAKWLMADWPIAIR